MNLLGYVSLLLALLSLATAFQRYGIVSIGPPFMTEGRRQSEVFSTSSPLLYDEPVFRPPAEWRSLILQVTIGCSWNKCSFCEMYQTKQFRAKPIEDIEQELQIVVATRGPNAVRDVFLADGDAMSLPTKQLMAILEMIQQHFPRVRRVSSYCLPRNIYYKSVQDLTELRHLGLRLVYVGCESGSDNVLDAVQKGETYETSLSELTKLQDAGIKRSIMILLGLGGKRYSEEHAIQSARLASASQPEFLSVLTTSFPRGLDRIEEGYRIHYLEQEEEEATRDTKSPHFFEPLTARESLQELYSFLQNTNITTNSTIFRSDHASNYLVLKGRLGRDKQTMLAQLAAVLDAPEEDDVYNLRPEWARGL
ncbi:radical SAM domain protein [Seminavis robusta]|uniref:Radical SAM domain protein n=1 Tax=Seminavis robusta TaxID=568900 RepID=A0A9N8ET09_9STRA|nr:radical SAM domain protein [Seminavis robusta]|eukprot:Sro1613_g286040.1 radical SAM domain protein (365) ;mRNA; f:18736-19830